MSVSVCDVKSAWSEWSQYSQKPYNNSRQLCRASFKGSEKTCEVWETKNVHFTKLHTRTGRNIELVFWVIKKKLNAKESTSILNFDKRSGRDAIVKVMFEINNQTVHKVWLRIIREAKKWILTESCEVIHDLNGNVGGAIYDIS